MAPRPRAVEEAGKQAVKQEIYYDGYLYEVTDWIPKHPGGKIIEFYTDEREDATIPIQQFHQRSIKQILARMKTLPKRPALKGDGSRVNNSERHRKLTEDFQSLFKQLIDEGYFNPAPIRTFCRFLEIVFFFSLASYFASWEGRVFSWGIPGVLTILFFACGMVRSGFAQHEGGHGSFTGNVKYDRWLHTLYLTFGMGLSSTWWSSQHNRHHAMPQRVHRDVDLDTLPLLAFNSKIALNAEGRNGNNFLIRHQAKLFLTIDTLLVGLFWKLYLHPKYNIHKRQWSQLVITALHYIAGIYLIGSTNFVLANWLSSIWLFGTFTLSHTHLPVTTENLHWVEYSLLHTVNIEPSWWCDWVMGYLNYQIEHHLFPTMPQFRHREVTGRVRKLAEKNGIPYRCISYSEGIRISLKNLGNVSDDIVKHKAN